MLWVLIAGMFLGANIGIIVACMLVSSKKRDAMVRQHNHYVEYEIMDEVRNLESKRSAKSSSQTRPIGS